MLTFHLFPDRVRYRTTDEIASFYTTVLDRLQAVPGIGETCAASHPPFGREGLEIGWGSRYVLTSEALANTFERVGAGQASFHVAFGKVKKPLVFISFKEIR